MSSVITAVAIPSLYALYVWYAHRTLDIPRQRQRRRADVPVALVASSTVKLRSDNRMSIKSVFAVDQPSPPVSNVLYTSRGDVAVNLNKDELSTDALAYLMEVTDSGDEALLDDENDDVIITRTDFDDMIKFAAEHFKELPFASVQTMSIEPRTSLASLLAQVTDNEVKTPLSQIFLLVDDEEDQASTSSSSPPSSIVREIATSSQARQEQPQTIHVSNSKTTRTRRPFGKRRASHPEEQEYFVFT